MNALKIENYEYEHKIKKNLNQGFSLVYYFD